MMYICIHNLGISFPVILSPGTDLSGALVLRRLCLMRGMDFEEASAMLERAPEDQEPGLISLGKWVENGKLWGNNRGNNNYIVL